MRRYERFCILCGRNSADPARRRRFLHDLGQPADLVVLAVETDVERLVVDELARRHQERAGRTCDVLDVDERPPGRPVAEDADLAGGEGPPDQIVKHDVQP